MPRPCRLAALAALAALMPLVAAQNPAQFDRLANANSGFTGLLGAASPGTGGGAAAPPPPPAVGA
jgi:hypothetical protein